MKTRVEIPAKYSGPLTAFLARVPVTNRAAEELRWYRAQMRSWAGHWRSRFEIAALVGKPVCEVADTDLYFAKMYRDESRKRGAR